MLHFDDLVKEYRKHDMMTIKLESTDNKLKITGTRTISHVTDKLMIDARALT